MTRFFHKTIHKFLGEANDKNHLHMNHVVFEKHNKILQGRSLRNNKPEDKFTYKCCHYHFQESYFLCTALKDEKNPP